MLASSSSSELLPALNGPMANNIKLLLLLTFVRLCCEFFDDDDDDGDEQQARLVFLGGGGDNTRVHMGGWLAGKPTSNLPFFGGGFSKNWMPS